MGTIPRENAIGGVAVASTKRAEIVIVKFGYKWPLLMLKLSLSIG